MASTGAATPGAARRRRPCAARVSLLAVLVASAWAAAAPPKTDGRSQTRSEGDAPHASAPARRLNISIDDLLRSKRVHTRYEFTLNRRDMKRQGAGEVWLSFAKTLPRMRWRGAARSPKFGDGQITVVIDPEKRVMYTLFQLPDLREKQCLIYPFPVLNRTDNALRLALVESRKERAKLWESDFQALEAGDVSKLVSMMRLQWSNNTSVEFELAPGGQAVSSMRIMRGSRAVKTINFPDGGLGSKGESNFDDEETFGPPSPDCRPVGQVDYPSALLELQLPHRRSSALNDLLLVLMDMEANPKNWPRIFLLLCALMVPGDVAVMIEDPRPPDLGSLQAVSFRYTAAVVGRDGARHASGGAIWLDLPTRVLHLRGEARGTEVGPLFMDLIARGGEDHEVFANINLTVEGQQQCVAYDYPTLDADSANELKHTAQRGMRFYAISSIHGEDCEIFEAPLARGRWIHIWVDLESETPNAILRSEVHRRGQVIRSTDVLDWTTADHFKMELEPEPSWNCNHNPQQGQLAHLGLHQVHRRSIELQDALYSLRKLDPEFAMLEILGLTGDVAIMVKEPVAPALEALPFISFEYSVFPAPATRPPGSRPTTGSFTADRARGLVRITAQDDDATITVWLDTEKLAVRLVKAGKSQCLTMRSPLDPAENNAEAFRKSLPPSISGIFDGVERVGEHECNRFSFVGAGPRDTSIELWYSNEEDVMCRMSTRPATDAGMGTWELVDIKSWKAGSTIQPQLGDADGPDAWNCQPVPPASSWLLLTKDEPAHDMPTASVLANLAQASGVIGILPHGFAHVLAHLDVMDPSTLGTTTVRTTTTPPPVNMFSPELSSFRFTFTSTFPLQGASHSARGKAGPAEPAPRHHSKGEVRVDLAARKLYIRSKAYNISYSMPEVDTRIVYRGDRGVMYSYVRIDGGVHGDFEECWDISTAEAFPPPPGGSRAVNPFQGAQRAEGRYSVLGHDSENVQKHVLYLGQAKRMQLFVSEMSGKLLAINADDLRRRVSLGITVEDWSTAPAEPSWFEPVAEWRCESSKSVRDLVHLAHWDLLRVFFPQGPAPAARREQEDRRLFEV